MIEEEQPEGPSPEDIAYAEALAKLHNLSPEQLLERGYVAMLKDLVVKSEMGILSHQELAILRNLLRDNGMTLDGLPSRVAEDGRQAPLLDDLPKLDRPDYN